MTDDANTQPSRPEHGPTGGEAYAVGYGRPPKATQFEKGRSGNPTGRPKGRRNVMSELREVFTGQVPITIGGKTRRMSRISVLHLKLWERGIRGDERAAARFIAATERLGLHCEPSPKESRSDGSFSDEEFESLSDQAQIELIAIYARRATKGQ